VSPRLLVFLDASVLLAAAGSPTGGSAEAMRILRRHNVYRGVVSTLVLLEARRNLTRKFPPEAETRLITLLAGLRPMIVQSHAPATRLRLPSAIAEKDRHIVEACVASGASICLTLNRRHLLMDELRAWGLQRRLLFVRPAEFIEWQRLRNAGSVQALQPGL
jgi:predicted nucleic acid-binding protein